MPTGVALTIFVTAGGAKMSRIFIIAFFCLYPSLSNAAPNGCGSGWNVWVVPNSIPLFSCKFKSCCDDHDYCYSRCEGRVDSECVYMRCREGGDLYGTSQCTTDEELLNSRIDADNRKRSCDNNFYARMREINKGKSVCEALAIVYRDAVKKWGDPSFSGLGEFAVPEAWSQPKEDYDSALIRFFSAGTKKQFSDFVRSNDQNNSEVHLDKPLRYDAKAGLQNIKVKK
jgi:hypothetical protein